MELKCHLSTALTKITSLVNINNTMIISPDYTSDINSINTMISNLQSQIVGIRVPDYSSDICSINCKDKIK
jgi:hypothetical protein